MDTADKATRYGVFGIGKDSQVSKATHYTHDPLLGPSIGFKTATQSRGEQLDAQLGGDRDKLFALIGWTKGGKRALRKRDTTPVTPTPERVEVRAGMLHVTPKWVALVKQFGGQLTPQEMDGVVNTIAASAGLHDTLREYLSRPAGPQVM